MMTKQDTPDPTRILADFAAGPRYDDLPQRRREHCKNLILDALACAVAGCQGVGELMAVLRASPQTRAMAAAE